MTPRGAFEPITTAPIAPPDALEGSKSRFVGRKVPFCLYEFPLTVATLKCKH
jgi:hypothetical protein